MSAWRSDWGTSWSGPWERYTDGSSMGCCGSPGSCTNPTECERPIQAQLKAAYGADWEKAYYGGMDSGGWLH